MKLLIDICTNYAESKINAQVSIYSLADLNIDHCIELTFLEGKLGNICEIYANLVNFF